MEREDTTATAAEIVIVTYALPENIKPILGNLLVQTVEMASILLKPVDQVVLLVPQGNIKWSGVKPVATGAFLASILPKPSKVPAKCAQPAIINLLPQAKLIHCVLLALLVDGTHTLQKHHPTIAIVAHPAGTKTTQVQTIVKCARLGITSINMPKTLSPIVKLVT